MLVMGITFEDEVRALILLGSLPDLWDTLKVALCNSAPDNKITWDLIKCRVLSEESRRATKVGSFDQAMMQISG